jgi:hypothetical protein
MLFGNAIEACKLDMTYKMYCIDCALEELLSGKRIKVIDKYSRKYLCEKALLDKLIMKGNWDTNYLKNLLRREFSQLKPNGIKKIH